MIGLTVVGNPAATVMTSSPGFNRRFPSRGEVRALTASRLADEPELTRRACWTPMNAANFFSKPVGEPSARQPEIQRRIHEVLQFPGVEDLSGNRHRRFTRHKRPRRKGRFIIGLDPLGYFPSQYFRSRCHAIRSNPSVPCIRGDLILRHREHVFTRQMPPVPFNRFRQSTS